MKKILAAPNICLLLSFFNSALADINDGLVAYYPFEDSINDVSPNALDGTANGVIEYIEGISGKAIKFNGTQDIELPIQLNGTPQNQYLTIAFWGKSEKEKGIFITNSNVGDAANSLMFSTTHIGIRGGFSGYWYNGYCHEHMFVTIHGESYAGDCTPYSNVYHIRDFGHSDIDYTKWHHYALTYDNDAERIYIDGILVAEVAIGANQVGGYNGSDRYPRHDEDSGEFCHRACFDRSLNIGVQNNAFAYPTSDLDMNRLTGLVDEVRIYNRALTESEIGQLHRGEPMLCTSDNSGTVSMNLDIRTPSLIYESPAGNVDIWAELEFHGQSDSGELLWRLKDYGVNE